MSELLSTQLEAAISAYSSATGKIENATGLDVMSLYIVEGDLFAVLQRTSYGEIMGNVVIVMPLDIINGTYEDVERYLRATGELQKLGG